MNALRSRPDDRNLALVTADALLAEGNPHGELMRAQLNGDARALASWLDEHGTSLLETKPASVRVCGGLVRQLVYEDAALTKLKPDALNEHPAAMLVTPAFDDKTTAATLERFVTYLEAATLFGLHLNASEKSIITRELPARLTSLNVVALRIPLELAPWLNTLVAPDLRALSISTVPVTLETSTIAKTVTHLRTRALDDAQLNAVLRWPALDTLDVKGITFTAAQQQRLREWKGTVLHEDFTLDARGPFEHVFSAAGVWWPQRKEHARHIVSTAFDNYISVHGTQLGGYVRGDPAWNETLASPARSVTADPKGYELTCEDGTRLAFTKTGKSAKPRVRARAATTRAQLESDSVVVVLDENDQLLHRWQLSCGLRTVITTRTGWAAASNQEVWVLAANQAPRLAIEDEDGTQALLASGGDWLTASLTSGQASMRRLDGKDRADWYCSTMRVLSIGCDTEGRALLGLHDGGINVLDGASGNAFKGDEFPGQRKLRWVFIFKGEILVAG